MEKNELDDDSRASQNYWDALWVNAKLPPEVDPGNTSLNNHAKVCLHKYFEELFNEFGTENMRLAEIGAAKSAWLPYFSRQFGFDVTGVDYSPVGCRMAVEILRKAGIKHGTVVETDFFSPPETLKASFDVVISFGVAEHFEDTSACLKAFGDFLKPGGVMFTLIPNMVGVIGWLQKYIDREVYDIHVLLDRKMLADAHKNAALEDIQCDYFLTVDLGVVNNSSSSGSTFYGFSRRLMSWPSKAVFLLERLFGASFPNRFTSPYIVCTARKPLNNS